MSELLINLASVVLLWFLGGLHANLRQRDEHGVLAPVVLASGAATVALGMMSDLAGTVAGLLAAVAILRGAIGSRWVGWLSVLSSAACLVSAVIGSLNASMVPPLGLLGFFITVIALRISMLGHRSPAPAAGPASRPATVGHQ
ncbi:MAG: hypothetical protein ABSB76_27005 [Streptosporangiaceae bacterium]